MTRSSLTEETPAMPGWAEHRLREAFAAAGPEADRVRDAYAACLAGVRGAADVLVGHEQCRRAALAGLGGTEAERAALERALRALETELEADT